MYTLQNWKDNTVHIIILFYLFITVGPAPFQTENDPFHGAPPNLEDFGISGKKSANLILVTLKLLIV